MEELEMVQQQIDHYLLQFLLLVFYQERVYYKLLLVFGILVQLQMIQIHIVGDIMGNIIFINFKKKFIKKKKKFKKKKNLKKIKIKLI
jgi:hypothetical protein